MRVGAIDIGTNTTRLLVASVRRGHTEWLERIAIVTTLGEGVDETGRLQPEPVARTLAVLARYRAAIEKWDAEAVRVVATSAVRDAANRNAFLDAAEVELGVRLEVIEGDEEAALSFAGTTAQFEAPGPIVVIDLGGGSTEFVLGQTAPEYAASVRIGSVRLTERFIDQRPLDPDGLTRARSHVDELLESGVRLPRQPHTAIGVGGTYTSLAAIYLDLKDYDPSRVHGTVITAVELHELTDRLARLSVREAAAIPSLDPARAPVILGGAIVAERSLRRVECEALTVSERDILDGIALSLDG